MDTIPSTTQPSTEGKIFTEQDLINEKLEELKLLEAKAKLQQLLPHKYGWKLYKWAQEYWDAREKVQLICAANQISKSSTQIRKHIHWATATELWGELWKARPYQFWYLYPTRDVAHIEFKKKWEPQFMPRGEYRYDHPKYGWKPEFYHNRIFAIHWNSGVSTYFKTYAQDVQDLQTGTVEKLDLDEETPEDLMGELFMRLAATEGYLSAVFTPTLGQEYWRCAIEEIGTKQERFPEAFKRQVSMFDCLYYGDGSKSPWSIPQINRAMNACKSQSEIDRRIYGKFIVSEGLKYPSFNRSLNRKPGHILPKDWSVWAGVDIGSGGDDNHPSAIVLLGVSPDLTQARVITGWRGDGVVTTAADVVRKLIAMIKPFPHVRIYYDWASRDFYNIATSMNIVVEPAEKSHVIGEQVLNVLFKNQMLWIYDYPELDPLCVELSTLKNATPKRQAKDDFVDALRYAAAKVPWNWEAIRGDLVIKPKEKLVSEEERQIEERKRYWDGTGDDRKLNSVDDEISAWQELLDGGIDDLGY